MKVLIAYDLKRVKNYPRLYQCLNNWKATRLLESMWLADLRGPPSAIMNILKLYIDGDDALVVIELPPGIDWSTLRARPAGVAHLHSLGPTIRAA